ncbi:MarR family winged helix-turn-helix transcriptional regulator [Streptomyces flaveus]|nr:MarR family transcriptional regulator [Streptomyces flaveus]
MTPRPSAAVSVSPDVMKIERALTRATYLSGRARQHERLMSLSGLPLDRAAVAVLRQLAESEPLRLGELAARLSVEASHVTRQVQHLERTGYATRIPDPDDRRAQRIQLTPTGREAFARVREASVRGMQAALADWSPEDLEQLASLIDRMVDDFVERAEAKIDVPPDA